MEFYFFILILLCLISILALLYLAKSGLLHKVDIRVGKPKFTNLKIAYKFVTGPYKESYKIYKEIIRLSPNTRYVAIYYDNPYKVPVSGRRYIVGAVLAEGQQTVDLDLMQRLKQNGYSEWDFPTVETSINTTFPYKNTLSIYLSAWKVYSTLTNYIETHHLDAGPCVEIWDGDVVHYLSPLDHKDHFFVKEIKPF